MFVEKQTQPGTDGATFFQKSIIILILLFSFSSLQNGRTSCRLAAAGAPMFAIRRPCLLPICLPFAQHLQANPGKPRDSLGCLYPPLQCRCAPQWPVEN